MKRFGVYIMLAVAIATFFTSCNNNKVQNVKRQIHNYSVPKKVTIYCFGDFSKEKAQKLAENLRTFFPNVELADESVPLPADQYYKPRNRYKGTGLFNELFARRDGDAIVGLTDYVIYKPNELSPTYGIFGVAPIGKYICVCSSKKARGGEHTEENFCKLALHELGHAFGLPHCPDQHCYMVDAEHKYKLPQSNYYCPKCKKFLNEKGWIIKSREF